MARDSRRPNWEIHLPDPAARRRALRWVAVVLLLVLLGVFALAGLGGIMEVKDNEVAVIVNYVTGEKTVDTVPGNKIFIPLIQEVFALDKSTNKFVMEGKEDLSTDHVRELTVRAKDGSNFWFESLEIQYQLIPGQAAVVLQSSGIKDAFKKFWLMSYARSILRDEFGKFDPEQIANPISYAAARTEAQARLNAALREQGIEITQITLPKPKFADEYEQTIEKRKLADQEVERLKAMAIQLEKEKGRRLAQIDSKQGQEYAALKGSLAAEMTQAEADAIKARREADAFKIKRAGEAEAGLQAKLAEAEGLVQRNRKEAEGLRAKAEALASQGKIVVVEALAEKLKEIELEIVPYQRQEAPGRIEVENGRAVPAAQASGAAAPRQGGR